MIDIRDYNNELNDTSDHKYAYDFDFDVMHPFMMRAFEPFLGNDDRALEMGWDCSTMLMAQATAISAKRLNKISSTKPPGKR